MAVIAPDGYTVYDLHRCPRTSRDRGQPSLMAWSRVSNRVFPTARREFPQCRREGCGTPGAGSGF